MIKKYNLFLNESKKSTIDSICLEVIDIYNREVLPNYDIKNFKNIGSNGVNVIDIINSIDNKNIHSYVTEIIKFRDDFSNSISDIVRSKRFSNLASSSNDPEKDFLGLQEDMDKDGFEISSIKLLFDPIINFFTDQDFSNFIRYFFLDNISGYVDIYLYKLNEKLNLSAHVYLGGEEWGEYIYENGEEYIIKYSYGYHKTLYGQLYLNNIGMSREDFIENTFLNIKEYVKTNVFLEISDWLFETLILKFYNFYYLTHLNHIDHNDTKSSWTRKRIFNIEEHLTSDDNSFIIHYVDMYNKFNLATDNKFKDQLNEDWFRDQVIEKVKIDNLDFQDTGEDLIFRVS